MAVVAVFSGEARLAVPPAEFERTVRAFSKGAGDGEGTPAVVAWLKEHAAMIRHIQSSQVTIRQEMAKIFTKSIWPRWTFWAEGNVEGSAIESAITRHITSHIYASLLEKGQHSVHPEEWYFVPPIRDGLRTGDLIKHDDGKVEIVITPRCDLARDTKNETVQLALCQDASQEWNTRQAKINEAKAELDAYVVREGEKDNRAKLEGKVKDALNHLRQFTQHRSNSTNFHFLPQMKMGADSNLGPFMVRFDSIRSVLRTDNEATHTLPGLRVAALTPEFLPSLVERLGTYFSRIGTPDYSHPD
jgi:hypothetical protein